MFLFLLLATVAVAASIAMITARNSVHSALFLVVVFFCLAVLYLTLNAEFLAVVQIVVYAGAIMVLFLFVLMLLNVRREEDRPRKGGKALAGIAAAAVAALVAQAGWVLLRAEPGPAPQFDASTRKMAEVLFSPHFLYVFEATSILILAALVGAVALAKKEL